MVGGLENLDALRKQVSDLVQAEENACMEEITTVLKERGCRFDPVVITSLKDDGSFVTQVAIRVRRVPDVAG
jgi:hypothetical protein